MYLLNIEVDFDGCYTVDRSLMVIPNEEIKSLLEKHIQDCFAAKVHVFYISENYRFRKNCEGIYNIEERNNLNNNWAEVSNTFEFANLSDFTFVEIGVASATHFSKE